VDQREAFRRERGNRYSSSSTGAEAARAFASSASARHRPANSGALQGKGEPGAEVDPEVRLRLVGLLAFKQGLLSRARRDVRYKALLDLWLLVHVPLSIGALVAVAAHVLAVFHSW
jgi:hypothetical protein